MDDVFCSVVVVKVLYFAIVYGICLMWLRKVFRKLTLKIGMTDIERGRYTVLRHCQLNCAMGTVYWMPWMLI